MQGYFSILFILLLSDCATSQRYKGVGLPFNLPGSRFCSPCEFVQTEYDVQGTPFDQACKAFTRSTANSQANNFAFKQLVVDLVDIKSPYDWVVYAYTQAKLMFEYIYQMTYDLNVFIAVTINDESCLKIFQDGTGFRTQGLKVPETKNAASCADDIKNGTWWEDRFFNSLRDSWAQVSCGDLGSSLGKTRHYKWSIQSANRWMSMSHESYVNRSNFKTNRLMLPPALYPSRISTRFMRDCNDSTYPRYLVKDIKSCDTLICPLSGQENKTMEASQIDPPNILQHNADQVVPASSSDIRRTISVANRTKSYIINEFSPHKHGHAEIAEFIEIRVVPPPRERESRYFGPMKLCAFTVYTKRLLLVVSLNQQQVQSNGFYFISGSNVPRSYVQKAVDVSETHLLLPSGEEEPIALLLLRKDSQETTQDWEKISLIRYRPKNTTQTLYNSRTMNGKDSGLLDIMRQFVTDAQFYGVLRNQKVPFEVKRLQPSKTLGCNYVLPILKEFRNNEMAYFAPYFVQLSFNLCLDFDVDCVIPCAFQYEKFKMGQPTPGNSNNCSREMPNSVRVTDHSCDRNVDTVGVTNMPLEPDQCPSSTPLIGHLKSEIEAQILNIRSKYNPSYENLYYPTTKFSDGPWKEIVRLGDVSLELVADITPYEIFEKAELPRAKFVRCKLCSERYSNCEDSFHFNQKISRYETSLVKGMQPSTDMAFLKRRLIMHLSTQQHLTSILYNVHSDRIKFSLPFEQNRSNYMSNSTNDYKQLANVFDIKFTLLHTNTAPHNTKTWYRTLRKMEANVGTALQSKTTAYEIIDFISYTGTNLIVQHLITNDQPFSLILDGSADARNDHYVTVYLQGLEGGVTMPYLIFLLKLARSFTAEAYLTKLKEAVSDRGESFEKYFKKNLVAAVTDSARVMVKFHQLLNGWLQRRDQQGNVINVISVYCLAHKLQLATRSAIVPLRSDKDVPADSPLFYFNYLEKFMQSSCTWFKWSGKRIGLFREIYSESDWPKVEMRELHIERWISSEYVTVKGFINSWQTARIAISTILDEDRDAKTQKEAKHFESVFKDKTAYIMMHFLLDYTAAFKIWSEHIQKMAGLMIDQHSYFERLQQDLTMLEEFRSPVLTKFLESCKCDFLHTANYTMTSEAINSCTLEEYESVDVVFCRGIMFRKEDEDAPVFSTAVKELIKKTRERLGVYIPFELLSSLSVLDPKRFPPGLESLEHQHDLSNISNITVYAEKEIRAMSLAFGFNSDNLVRDWALLVSSMVRSDTWRVNRVITDADQFWANVLRDNTITWTNLTRRFIYTAKVIAPGSVACETGFSIFNVIKTKARMGITKHHVESIMKILINGPGDVEQFDSSLYAIYWLTSGHRNTSSSQTKDEETCTLANEERFEITQDIEQGPEVFHFIPWHHTESLYEDSYDVVKKSVDFIEHSKLKRTQERSRSRIM